MNNTAFETVLRRDRLVVAGALGVLTALAWSHVLWLAADMDMGGMDMSESRVIPAGMGIMAPALAPWSVMEFALVFAMWAVMMVGMMTPSAAPMILIYARVGRQAAIADKPFAATGWFAAGYMMTEAADNLRPWVICCSCETSAESQLLCSRPRPALKHRRGALSR